MTKKARANDIFLHVTSVLPAFSGGERFTCTQNALLTEIPGSLTEYQQVEEGDNKMLSYGLVELSPGVVVSYANSKFDQSFSFGGTSNETLLAFRLIFKGEVNQIYKSHYVKTPRSPSCSYQLLREGEPFAISLIGEPEAEIIGLYITIDKLVELLSVQDALLPRPLSEFRASTLPFDNGHFTSSAKSLAAARELLAGVSNALFSDIHARSKGLELLYLLFDDWFAAEKTTKNKKNRFKLSEQDVRQLEKLHQHIRDNFYQVQSLEQLLKIGQLNRNKLHYGFREIYGSTIKQYQTRLRMEWAREQLVQGTMSVAGIADQLDYQEPNSFSAAFRRYYGVAPTQIGRLS